MVSPTLTLPPNLAPTPPAKTDEPASSSETSLFSQSLIQAVKEESGGKAKQGSADKPDDEDKSDGDKSEPKPPPDVGQIAIAALLNSKLKIETTNEGIRPTIKSVTVDSQGGETKPTSGAVNASNPSNQSQNAQATADSILNLPNQNTTKADTPANEKKGFTLPNLLKPVTLETWNASVPNQTQPSEEPTFSAFKESAFQAFNMDGLDRLSLSLPIEKVAQPDGAKPTTTAQAVVSGVPVLSKAESQSADSETDQQADSKEKSAEAVANIRAGKSEASLSEKFTVAENATKEVSETGQSARLNVIERMQVIEQASRKMETMRLQNGNGEVNLHLRPERLGEIQIRLTSNAEGVSVRILAESHPVREALESAREQLKRSLESRGVSLKDYEVSLHQGAFSGGQSPQRQGYEASQSRAQPRNTEKSFRIDGVEPVKPTVAVAPRASIRDPLALLDYSA